MTVLDDETPSLTLMVTPDHVSETGGARAARGTVTRNTPVARPLVVTLSSNNTDKARVPANVTIPAGDPLWDNDVGRAFHWLGAVWAEVLAAEGLSARVHDGGLRSTPWSGRVCFAGLGPGEVTVEGRKVVGLSQRRTREAARFQCCALLRWEPERLLDVLTLDDEERRRGTAELRDVAAGAGAVPDLAASFLAAVTAR